MYEKMQFGRYSEDFLLDCDVLLGEGIQGEVLLNAALYGEGPSGMALIFFYPLS